MHLFKGFIKLIRQSYEHSAEIEINMTETTL